MEYQAPNAVAARLDAERIRAALIPPEKLTEVVQPNDLAALVAPARWAPLQDIRRKITDRQTEGDRMKGELSRVEVELAGLDARRPMDAVGAAEAWLAGTPVPPPAEVAPRHDRASLTAVRDGLRLKAREVEAEIGWLTSQARVEEARILEEALTEAAVRYVGIVKELAHLHVAIDAGAGILSPTKTAPLLGHAWREVVLPAPPFAPRHALVEGRCGERDCIASFQAGRGVQGASEAWRRAVKAACGASAL